MAYTLNKALSSYIEMNRDTGTSTNEEENVKKVYPKVDIHEAMNEIDESIGRVNELVKKDLEKIAMLDIKIKSR